MSVIHEECDITKVTRDSRNGKEQLPVASINSPRRHGGRGEFNVPDVNPHNPRSGLCGAAGRFLNRQNQKSGLSGAADDDPGFLVAENPSWVYALETQNQPDGGASLNASPGAISHGMSDIHSV